MPSCDDTNIGRLELDPKPPVVTRILVQDANSYQVTDLLNHNMPLVCSDTNPCPAGTLGLSPTTCTIPDGKTEGTCDNPTSADNEVVLGDAGTIQIRIILSKILESDQGSPNAVEKPKKDDKGNTIGFELADPSVIQLIGPDNKEVAVDKYYDGTGSNWDTPDPIFEPLGPALVMNFPDQLIPGATYTVKIKGASLKDDKGQAITNDINGALKDAYTFKTEGLYVASVAPKASAVAPNDVVSFTTNGYLDDASISATVKDEGGATVTAIGWPELDEKTCAGAAGNIINVFPTDAGGNPGMWKPGAKYTITITAKDAASGTATLMADPLIITVGMTAGDPAKDAQAVDNHILPVPCNNILHPPMDGGATD